VDASLAEELAAALGAPVGHHQPVHGGDTTDAWRVELADGRTAFVKTRAGAPPGFFEGEADGLEAIASTGAVAVPVVLAVGTRFLALEWVEGGGDLDAVRLGRELAALHRSAPPVPPLFGWRRANFVGAVLQDNTPCASWPEFYATRRPGSPPGHRRGRARSADRPPRRADRAGRAACPAAR
jgi:fructosamine-3-kinase